MSPTICLLIMSRSISVIRRWHTHIQCRNFSHYTTNPMPINHGNSMGCQKTSEIQWTWFAKAIECFHTTAGWRQPSLGKRRGVLHSRIILRPDHVKNEDPVTRTAMLGAIRRGLLGGARQRFLRTPCFHLRIVAVRRDNLKPRVGAMSRAMLFSAHH